MSEDIIGKKVKPPVFIKVLKYYNVRLKGRKVSS